ncbi:MAG: hypothetical protein ACPGRX_09750, partial [Bdellovibrionales bacterium]
MSAAESFNYSDQFPDRINTGSVVGASLEEIGNNGGFSIFPKPPKKKHIQKNHPIITSVGQIWNEKEYAKPHPPLILKKGVKSLPIFPEDTFLNVSSLPIKFPNMGYRVPIEFESLKPFIRRCAGFEHAINPEISSYFCYLTVDQRNVEAGNGHRSVGAHCDGIQGPRINPKRPVERFYLLTDSAATTRFYDQTFNLGDAKANTHDLTKRFQTQADPNKIWTPEYGKIAILDSYTVHEGPLLEEAQTRLLVKLIYAS